MSWLTGWQYRKSHEIEGSTAGAVTDYQVRITVHYGGGTDSDEHVYLNGKCRTDFGDIRFTDSDGVTELPYWMEEKVDGDYAIFWVKVPSIPASPESVTIYIYYGKSDAESESNGDATFLFFDDFIGTELDPTKWTEDSSLSGGVTETGVKDGYYYQKVTETAGYSGNPVAEWLRAKHLITLTNFHLHTKQYWWQEGDDVHDRAYLKLMDASENEVIHVGMVDWSYSKPCQYHTAIGGVAKGVDWAQSGSVTMEWDIYRYGSDVVIKKDGVDFQSGTASEEIAEIWLRDYWDMAVHDFESRWHIIWIRNYIDPEPTHGAWGSEETAPIYKICGYTRDANGNPLGGCTVWLFRTSDKQFIDETISDENGYYEFTVPDNVTEYFIRAHKDGTPNVFGTTDRNLKGEEV